MQALPQALAPLGAYRQFLNYVLVPSRTKPGKTDKFPVSPYTGQVASAHDPANWTTAEHACQVAGMLGAGYGVAFSFQRSDPFFFIDIDNAYTNGQWSQLSQQVVGLFPGAAIELSQSGTGLHIIGRGMAPPHGKKNQALGLEFYTEERFIALTGNHAQGNAATDHTAALRYITAHVFPPGAASNGNGSFTLSTEPVPEWRGPTDDADLIRRALQSRSTAAAFGQGATFADLWEANVDVLAKAYPDPSRPFDESSADMALAAHLAFWTGRHGERMERLLRASGLVREKWSRDDYLPRTIASVLAKPGDVLKDKPMEVPAGVPLAMAQAAVQAETGAVVPPVIAGMRSVEGSTFLNAEAQRVLFNGCVYVSSAHRVLVPGGNLLKPDQFKVIYGGYTFAMDNLNERTSRNAWEAFTESQVLRAPIADTTRFKPAEPPGLIVNDQGRNTVNVWWPALIKRVSGDPSPFLRHLEKIFPDERDRAIILTYMAACVQLKGTKFPWMPVVQGVQGNGKTLLALCVARAIGARYTFWPKVKSLESQFNAWLGQTVFVGIEELYSQEHQDQVAQNLLTMITGDMGIQIEQKGVDAVSQEICANLMATTNHKNAVRKTMDTARRMATFFTPQQSWADIQRDGMAGEYFPNLYGWLKYQDGFAIVADLLHTHPIENALSPAGAMHRAPHTSTTDKAILESRGNVEQQIAEAIAQETPGMMGGWISSTVLDTFINERLRMGSRLSHSKRRELLGGMGYILHPGLHDGRVNNPVTPDMRKPQLFITTNHPTRMLTSAADITRAYTQSQTVAAAKVNP